MDSFWRILLSFPPKNTDFLYPGTLTHWYSHSRGKTLFKLLI